MPYVHRVNGTIVEAFAVLQTGYAEELLSDDNAELIDFLNPPVTVAAVSARQFKLQLLAAGLLDQVDAWVAQQARDVRIAYEYSGTFVKDSPMMTAGFAALGFTASAVDAFFLAASKL
ncbi:hypothetical protein HF265_00465 [Rhizobium leguminosarum]|uniref:hypothetical protein n=1 Tax=Rhizobium leguminosarum TaxID=384 RepID=UPI00102F8E53|nr:hypothetical protein [Rhizobium leguminosarum]MBY3027594.1 hypothetical protein [Rhizobium leguminosarum]TBF41483.1 hypothetical protein ELG92_16105 [Rhizobium leguminosarum]